MSRIRALLERIPITTSIVYTAIGVFPLFVTAAQSVRLQDELGFDRPRFGLVVASYYLVSSIASKQVGPVLDRRGPAFGYRYAGLITVAGSLVAVSARNWGVLAVAMGIAGLANAFGQIASNLVIATVVDDSKRGRAFAAKQSAVPVGAMVAGLLVPWVGLAIGWRVSYWLGAALGLLMAVVAPRFPGFVTTGRVVGRSLTPALVAFMVTAAIGGGIGNSVSSFVSDAAVSVGFSETMAARVLTLGSVVAIVSRLTVGAVADRRRGTGVGELVTLLGVAVAGLLVLGAAGDSTPGFLVGMTLAFAGTWGWQGVMFYTVTHMIRLPAATSTGAVAAGAYFGTVVVPPLMGLGAERWSYEMVFLISAGVVVVGIGSMLVSSRLASQAEAGGNGTGRDGSPKTSGRQ